MTQSSNNTVNGLKQIIANMLQMRTPGSASNAYSFYGAVISDNSTSDGLPSGYYALSPALNINEFAVQSDYVVSANGSITLNIRTFIEVTGMWQEHGNPGGTGILEFTINSITCDGSPLPGAPFTRNGSTGSVWASKRLTSYNNWDGGKFLLSFPVSSIPSSITISMGDVKLYAGSSVNASALRDWLPGSLINSKMGNGISFAINPPGNATTANAWRTINFNPGNTTLQRIDPRVKGETAWAIAPYTFPSSGNTLSDEGGTINASLVGGHNTYRINLAPSATKLRDIPGDPHCWGEGDQSDYFAVREQHWVFYLQKLETRDSSGNYTFNSAHDLGKVATNVTWRRLRFMPRH
jgi:hypothetical protein